MAKGFKTGGRSKGTPNKPKVKLLEMLQKEFPDYHPIIALAKLAEPTIIIQEGGIEVIEEPNKQLQFLCHREIAKYLIPRPKAVDSNAETEDDSIQLLSNDELIEEVIKLLKPRKKGLPGSTSK